jgi:hypothetical protein
MAGRGKKDCDDAIVLALASGSSAADAAAKANCGVVTVYRRLADPAFKQRVADMRAELISRAVGRLSALGVRSVDELEALLSDEKSAIRLGAAKTVLEFMFRGQDTEDMRKEFEEMKAIVKGLEGKKP